MPSPARRFAIFRFPWHKRRESFFATLACIRFAMHPLAPLVANLQPRGCKNLCERFLTTAQTCPILNLAEVMDPPFRPR
jgi:hypothetical protein